MDVHELHARKGQGIYIQMTVPLIDRLSGFHPAFERGPAVLRDGQLEPAGSGRHAHYAPVAVMIPRRRAASTASVRRAAPSFERMRATWVFTVGRDT